jgi:hypothetical protein
MSTDDAEVVRTAISELTNLATLGVVQQVGQDLWVVYSSFVQLHCAYNSETYSWSVREVPIGSSPGHAWTNDQSFCDRESIEEAIRHAFNIQVSIPRLRRVVLEPGTSRPAEIQRIDLDSSGGPIRIHRRDSGNVSEMVYELVGRPPIFYIRADLAVEEVQAIEYLGELPF